MSTETTKPNGQAALPFPTPPSTGPYPDRVPAAKLLAAVPGDKPPQVMELPTRFFRPLPGNRKVTLEDVTRSGLLENIRLNGQVSPGLCTPDKEPGREGCWLVVGGNSRWLCCDALSMAFRFIPVEGDASLARMVRLSLADNVRKSLSQIEVAEQIELFMRESGISRQSDAAAALGMSEPEVCRALALPKRLCPALHDKARNFVIGRSVAELIAALDDHQAQEKAAEYYLSFPPERRPKRDFFKAYVDGLKGGGKRPKARAKPVTVAGAGCKVTITGSPLDALKWLHAKAGEAVKRLERGDIPPEHHATLLPSIMKG